MEMPKHFSTVCHSSKCAGHQLNVPRHRRTNFGRRAFAVARQTAWNSLPDYLRDLLLSEDTLGDH